MVIFFLGFTKYHVLSCLIFLQNITLKIMLITFNLETQLYFLLLDQSIITIHHFKILTLIFGFLTSALLNFIHFKISIVLFLSFFVFNKIFILLLNPFSALLISFNYLSVGISLHLILLINIKLYKVLQKKIHYTAVILEDCNCNSYWFIFRCILGLGIIRHSFISTNTNILKFIFVISVAHILYFIIKQ